MGTLKVRKGMKATLFDILFFRSSTQETLNIFNSTFWISKKLRLKKQKEGRKRLPRQQEKKNKNRKYKGDWDNESTQEKNEKWEKRGRTRKAMIYLMIKIKRKGTQDKKTGKHKNCGEKENKRKIKKKRE